MMGPEATGSGFFTQPKYRRLPPYVIFHAGGDQTVIRAVSEDRPHRPKVDHLAGLGVAWRRSFCQPSPTSGNEVGTRSIADRRQREDYPAGHGAPAAAGAGRRRLSWSGLGAAASERLPAGVRQPRP